MILRPAKKEVNPPPAAPRSTPRMLQACGRTEAAVNALLEKGEEHATDESFLCLLNDLSGIPPASMPYRGYTLIGSQNPSKEVQQVPSSARPLWYICSGETPNKPILERLGNYS